MHPEQLLEHLDAGRLWPGGCGLEVPAAYERALVVRALRLARGEQPRGFKIGFTNRSIWARYGVYEPIWGTVYDRTLIEAREDHATVVLAGLHQPRIEPEICFRLRAAPRSSSTTELLACIESVAHSIEIVQCDQPGWKTSLEHSTAFNGLHGRLIVGSSIEVDRLT